MSLGLLHRFFCQAHASYDLDGQAVKDGQNANDFLVKLARGRGGVDHSLQEPGDYNEAYILYLRTAGEHPIKTSEDGCHAHPRHAAPPHKL